MMRMGMVMLAPQGKGAPLLRGGNPSPLDRIRSGWDGWRMGVRSEPDRDFRTGRLIGYSRLRLPLWLSTKNEPVLP